MTPPCWCTTCWFSSDRFHVCYWCTVPSSTCCRDWYALGSVLYCYTTRSSTYSLLSPPLIVSCDSQASHISRSSSTTNSFWQSITCLSRVYLPHLYSGTECLQVKQLRLSSMLLLLFVIYFDLQVF